jgi:hypothetical protein
MSKRLAMRPGEKPAGKNAAGVTRTTFKGNQVEIA